MRADRRRVAFVVAATSHGTIIVNRYDRRLTGPNTGIGVGFQLLEAACFDADEVDLVLGLLGLRRTYFGAGVVAIDCGANIGVHTIEWARAMTQWGSVVAVEAQERIFYALAVTAVHNSASHPRRPRRVGSLARTLLLRKAEGENRAVSLGIWAMSD